MSAGRSLTNGVAAAALALALSSGSPDMAPPPALAMPPAVVRATPSLSSCLQSPHASVHRAASARARRISATSRGLRNAHDAPRGRAQVQQGSTTLLADDMLTDEQRKFLQERKQMATKFETETEGTFKSAAEVWPARPAHVRAPLLHAAHMDAPGERQEEHLCGHRWRPGRRCIRRADGAVLVLHRRRLSLAGQTCLGRRSVRLRQPHAVLELPRTDAFSLLVRGCLILVARLVCAHARNEEMRRRSGVWGARTTKAMTHRQTRETRERPRAVRAVCVTVCPPSHLVSLWSRRAAPPVAHCLQHGRLMKACCPHSVARTPSSCSQSAGSPSRAAPRSAAPRSARR
jgi:hypothetical protein